MQVVHLHALASAYRIATVKRSEKVMNKAELVEAISQKTNVSKKETDSILTAMLEEIMAAVASGSKVTFVGFGSFEPRERQARSGRNPKTGETMTIPATRVPVFSAGKSFKDKVAPSE